MTKSNEILGKFKTREEINMAYEQLKQIEDKEEIIIDGIDVAGCKYYLFRGKQPKGDRCCGVGLTNCNGQDCTYKQLKRLEQENKDFEILAKSLYKKIEELEKENEALAFRKRLYKADYEASEQENKELKNKNICRETCEYFKRICDKNTLLIKYRSALEEINILVKNYCNACDEFKAKTYKNKNDCLYCNYGFIKNKINEVLNA